MKRATAVTIRAVITLIRQSKRLSLSVAVSIYLEATCWIGETGVFEVHDLEEFDGLTPLKNVCMYVHTRISCSILSGKVLISS